jgi:hypothetical protein
MVAGLILETLLALLLGLHLLESLRLLLLGLALNIASDVERKKLLEKQLHTAREAERREAARSTAPAANAWPPPP